MKPKTYPILLFSILFLLIANACRTSQSDSSGPSEAPSTTLPTKPKVTSPSPTQPMNFSVDSANTVLPADILQEVAYYGIGGGPLVGYCGGFYGSPTIVSDPIDTELMANNDFVTCGWPAGENLTGKITYPDGRVITQTLNADQDGGGVLSLRSLLSDPEGIYQFEITGGGIDFVSNAYFYQPVVPRAYELDDQTLLLHNFKPGEKIRLFRYSCNEFESDLPFCSTSWKFEGWQGYTIGETGDLVINALVGSGLYYVVSTDDLEINVWSLDWTKGLIELIHSSEEKFSESSRELQEASIQYRRCPNDVQTRIKFSEYGSAAAQVAISDGSVLKIYANPRTDSRVKLEVKQGTILDLRGDYSSTYQLYLPICSEGKVWWEAYLYDEHNSQQNGYVIEYDDQGSYYIEQVDEGSIKERRVTCGGLESRLSPGEEARVAYTDGSNMRIRARPGFSKEILNKVPEGTLITILDGPECADSSTWWKIRTESGIEGWMTEEQDGVYLLEPYP